MQNLPYIHVMIFLYLNALKLTIKVINKIINLLFTVKPILISLKLLSFKKNYCFKLLDAFVRNFK